MTDDHSSVEAVALRELYKAYVSTLEAGRDRIMSLGGDCDTVERMEEGDPALIKARAIIAATPAPSDQDKLVGELVEALRTASNAITEMFRYYYGGETRGSYDGKPERDQLRKAGYIVSAALTRARQSGSAEQ